MSKFIATTIRDYLKEHQEIENNLNDNFWIWFGDSKVIENGKPIICYHGSNSDIKKFDLNNIGKGNSDDILQSGHGIYFTNSKDNSKKYGSFVKSVFLRIENPIYKDKSVPQKLTDFCLKTYPKLNTLSEYEINLKIGTVHRVLNFLQNARQDTSKVLMDLGYDGIIDNGFVNNYIVFQPNQIKSVENDGT